jgi:hypothetical protein
MNFGHPLHIGTEAVTTAVASCVSGTRNGIKSDKLQTILCQHFAANTVQMKRHYVCVCAIRVTYMIFTFECCILLRIYPTGSL